MFKKILGLVTVISLIASMFVGITIVSAGSEVNFIEVPNGTFEADAVGNNGTITNWYNLNPSFVAAADLAYGIETKPYGSANQTNKALKLYDGNASTLLAIGSEKIAITPGVEYKFLFDYMTTRGIYHSVNFYNASGQVYQNGIWQNPLEGNVYGLNYDAGANLMLTEPGSSAVFHNHNTPGYVAPANATHIRIVFVTTAARTYTSYFDNVKLAIVYDEKPTNEYGKHYVNVPNPGFERGNTGVNGVIPGWTLMGVSENTTVLSSNLYYEVADNYGKDNSTRGLYLNDNISGGVGTGINVVSDKIYLPSTISGKAMNYTLEFDYNTSRQAGTFINYYSSDGKLWNGSAWKAIDTAYNHYVAADATGYKSFEYYESSVGSGGPGLDIWSTHSRTLAAPTGTVAIRVGFMVSPYFTSLVKFDNVKLSYTPTYVNVSVATFTNGIESSDGGYVTTGATIESGEKYTITATPLPGYVIDSIKYGDVEVVSDQNGEYTYTTPAVTADKIIQVNFVPDYSAVKVVSSTKVFDYLDTEKSVPVGITFATAKSFYGSYNLTEYGMMFSMTEQDPEIGKADCIKAKGEVARNSAGQYGIKFIGSKIKAGVTYFSKAYAIYSNGTDSITVYGDKATFTPTENIL